MKSAGVFLGGLGSVLACNLMLIGVCSSASSRPSPQPAVPPAAPPPPPPPLAIVKVVPKAEPMTVPLGMFLWGCGGRLIVDPEGALPLPVCPPLR